MTRYPFPTVTTPPSLDHAVLDSRAELTEVPELCGFVDRTSATKCPTGMTCKFNTDHHAIGCCRDDECDWQTTCCGYNPGPSTVTWDTFTSSCGGPTPSLIGYCDNSSVPFCATNRFENGFTGYFCTGEATLLTGNVFFTSAGETTAFPGLPRLTGSKGPATASTVSTPGAQTVVVRVTETATSGGPSPGVIAGSVVGGAAFGAMAALLAVLLTWYFRKSASSKAVVVKEVGAGENRGSGEQPSYGGTEPSGSPIHLVSATSETIDSPFVMKDWAQIQQSREIASQTRHELPSRDGRSELPAR